MSPSSTSSSETGADREGLIALPAEPDARTSSALRWFVFLGFLVVSAGTGITDTLFPAARPRMALHQELEYEARRERARISDGSAARLLEYDLRLTSRVRRSVSVPYSTFLYEVLHEPAWNVIRGEGDWLFMRERVIPPPRSDDEIAGLGSAAVAALDRRVHALGLPLVVAPIPRKSVMHPDKLPRGVDQRPGLDRVVIDAVADRGVRTVDLLRAFREDAVEGIYYPCDSHWSAASQLLAAEAMLREAGRLAPEEERRTVVRQGDAVTPPGRLDLLPYMDVHLAGERLRELRRQGLHNYTVEMREGPARRFPPELASGRAGGRIAISGTSFTDGKVFPTYLVHFSQEPVLNGSMSAANFGQPLHELLRRRADFPELDLILVEFAIHQLFFAGDEDGYVRLPDSFGRALADLLPPFVSRVPTAAGFETASAFAGAEWVEVGGHEPARVGALPAGAIAHGGDGVVALEVRGESRGTRPMLDVRIGDVRMRADWPRGADRVVLPLVTGAAGAPAVEVLAHGQGDAALRIVGVRVVTEGPSPDEVAPRARVLRFDEAPAADGAWRLRAAIDEPLDTRRLAALLCGPDGLRLGADAELVLRAGDRERVVRFGDLDASTPVMAALGSAAGDRVTAIEWRGTGALPAAPPNGRRMGLVD